MMKTMSLYWEGPTHGNFY